MASSSEYSDIKFEIKGKIGVIKVNYISIEAHRQELLSSEARSGIYVWPGYTH